MTELRRRFCPRVGDEDEQTNKSAAESQLRENEDNLITELSQDPGSSQLSQSSDSTTKTLASVLKTLSPRWRNWIIRAIFTLAMLFGFAIIIYIGPLALAFVIVLLQIQCFHEIISIGYVVYRSLKLPMFRVLSWFFLFTSNFFFFGESLINYFGLLLSRTDFLRPFVTYHRFISFSLYICGFVGFVCSLRKKHYFKQFTLFGYTHVVLMLVVFQSHLIIQNLLEGLVWVLVPVSMIICNDIMAYVFGFFFGKTPLIKLSPKKTWEGFIGGAASTIVFGVVFSHILVQFDYFVCPVTYDDIRDHISMECERSSVFVLTEYKLPGVLYYLTILVGLPGTLQLYPFVLHSILMSIFASFMGPFGGFFASGLKRAYRIKDFGDTIPGHGGIVDRFDCQFLMASFVHVYNSSFIKMSIMGKLLQNILMLPVEDQVRLYHMLKDKMITSGVLKRNGTTM